MTILQRPLNFPKGIGNKDSSVCFSQGLTTSKKPGDVTQPSPALEKTYGHLLTLLHFVLDCKMMGFNFIMLLFIHKPIS